jgi:ferredoxin-type protein NapF
MTLTTHPGRRGLLFGRLTVADEWAVRPVAVIAPSCLAFRGVACMTCRDACPAAAIRFSLVRGGAVPQVETEACTGCAECIAVCPASAIALTPPVTGGMSGA